MFSSLLKNQRNKILFFTTIVSLITINTKANAGIIESYTGDSPSKIKSSLDGSCKSGRSLTVTDKESRDDGGKSYKHEVKSCAYRAEHSFKTTKIGETYWQGWSMLIPENYDHEGNFTIIGQWATYPSPRNGNFPCGANGNRLDIRDNGELRYSLQYASKKDDSECQKFKLGDIKDIRGKWVDFVQHAKWTGNSDGFLKLWMRTEGGEYKQVINYQGPTWWNDEDKGPYFKMGIYSGSDSDAPDRILYTDEYKLGDSKSSLEEVSP